MAIESGGALLSSVQQAINTLGSGFLAYPANYSLREKLRDGKLQPQNYYHQVLRLVYRLMILFVAEDRGVLPQFQSDKSVSKRYSDYSTVNLRDLLEQDIGPHPPQHAKLYRKLMRMMARMGRDTAHARLALPILRGFLFSSQAMQDLEKCGLTDHDLLRAVRSLTFTDDDHNGGRCPVDYKTLSAAELGSVYESLLAMHPKLDIEAATFVLNIVRGNERKMSGSYYTPTSLIDCLLDSTLEPVLAEACGQHDVEKAILNLKVCDPACGCGHFLIAAAHRIAKKLAVVRTENEEPGPETRRAALCDVMSRCIYGVDIDPMAVELCKVNLWMEVMEPGQPFPLLDAHIQCGNSLLGATPALLAQGTPNRAFQGMNGRLLANAWCAAFVWKKTREFAYPITEEVLRGIEKNPDSMVARMKGEIKRLAEQYRFFHWHLAFPDVFHLPRSGELLQNDSAGWSGGFDVVLGNPPYLFGENHDRRTNSMLKTLFRLATGQFDASWLFIEQGLKLTREHGRLALVVPDALLTRDEAQKTRELMLKQGLECICYCGTVFKASVSTIIFVVAKGRETGEVLSKVLDGTVVNTRYRCNKQRFFADPKHRFLTHMSDEEAAIFSRIESACQPLGNYVKISRGEELGKKDVHADGSIPILVGDDISRYFLRKPSRFLHKIKKDAVRYHSPKIVITKTGSKCIASLDHMGYVTMQSVYSLRIVAPDITYESLLALLNSRFVDCFIFKTFTSYKQLFPQLNQSTIEAIPVPAFVRSVSEEIDALVQCIQSLKIEMATVNMAERISHANREIEHLNKKLDKLVYEAYGISTEEIEIIESNIP
jgi:type I restriction-modification system DNA methylase subunit